MSDSFGWRSWFKRRKKKSPVARLGQEVRELAREVEIAKILAARGLVHAFSLQPEAVPLAQREFQVFSQFGDDGIIQYVLQRLQLPAVEHRFVEFGVEDYTESNTRFLLLNDNWSGLVMDGGEANAAYIRRDEIYWRQEITALACFITRENINALLEEGGMTGRIGLLSIDIDGNDYWVWEAITAVDPALVIVEYNSIFGPNAPVTIPYQADFTRHSAHFSNLYWGTSLGALCHLAERKGYAWIGCNRAGNNAYFVRKADAGRFLPVKLPGDFVAAKFREGRNPDGKLTYQSQQQGLSQIRHLPVWDVVENRSRPLSETL